VDAEGGVAKTPIPSDIASSIVIDVGSPFRPPSGTWSGGDRATGVKPVAAVDVVAARTERDVRLHRSLRRCRGMNRIESTEI